MQRMMLKFEQLIHNPGINPRSVPGNVEDLAAQIEHRGFTDALWVRRANAAAETFEVIDGSRRIAALQLLWERGKISDAFEIPCDVFDVTVEEAREMALAANVVRSELSPADEAQGFYRLKLAGMAVAEIAAHFAVSERRVEQRLRLGALPHDILEALRTGAITLAAAQAFTLTPSAERQAELWKTLTTTRGATVSEAYVRNALTGNAVRGSDGRAVFVGDAEYEAAGGGITRDLFAENVWFDDEPLLAKLFDEKLARTAQALKDEGWSFVEIERDTNKTYKYWSWDKIKPKGKRELTGAETARLTEIEVRVKAIANEAAAMPENDDLSDEQMDHILNLNSETADLKEEAENITAKPFTSAQMKKSGCAILLRFGEVDILKGLVRPAKGKPAEPGARDEDEEYTISPAAEAAPAAPVKAGYSDAAEETLRAVALGATQRAMAAAKPAMAYRLGLAARILQALYRGFDAPFEGMHRGQSARTATPLWGEVFDGFNACSGFADVLALLETETPEEIIQVEALLASDLLKFNSLGNADVRFAIEAVDPDMHAAGWRVDAAFLKLLSRDQLADLVEDCGDPRPAKALKKPELLSQAETAATREGWLPAKLRTPSYTGPGSNAWTESRAAKAANLEAAE